MEFDTVNLHVIVDQDFTEEARAQQPTSAASSRQPAARSRQQPAISSHTRRRFNGRFNAKTSHQDGKSVAIVTKRRRGAIVEAGDSPRTAISRGRTANFSLSAPDSW